MDRFFEVVVTEHRLAVFGLLFTLTRDRDLAEDLTQETFLVLLQKIEVLDVSQPILPWLLATGRNLAANARRHQAVEQRLLMNGDVATTFWQDLGGSDLGIDWLEKFAALGECRKGLPTGQKEAVTQFYDKQQSCDSIASMAGTAVTAIHNRLARARKSLRECIESKLRRQA